MTVLDAEISRIRAEYARRSREIADGAYGWDRPANLFEHQGVVRECIRNLAREKLFPLDGRRVADIGCGTGTWLLEFLQWGARPEQAAGIDLIPERVQIAGRRIPGADVRVGDASCLPWSDASFDLISQFTVFTSVLQPDLRRLMAAEMLRVLKPGGVLLWYDFRLDNPRNRHVKGIRAREIRSLFAPFPMRLVSVTLAPPLARLVVPLAWLAAQTLERIPILRTHYLAVIRKSCQA